MDRLINALEQLWLGRWLIGGTYVRMQDRWYACSTLFVCSDGTRVLKREDEGGGSFHETFNGIQVLQEF